MSVHYSSAVWKLRGIDAPSKLILLKLADHTGDTGESWPSLQTITDETGLSRATVCRKLAALEAAEIIQRCPGGPGVSTCYLLRSLIPEAKERQERAKQRVVSQRDEGSLSLTLPIVSGRDGHSLPVRPESSLNHHKEPSLNHHNDHSDDFLEFWKAYPRKVGKAAAWKKWKTLKPDLQTVLKAIEAQRRSDQWRKDGGQFIPHPETWLNKGRWEDEVSAPITKPAPTAF